MVSNRFTAHWLWAAGESFSYRRFTNTYVFARAEIELPAAPTTAPVRVTADARYRLFVNQQAVSRGPARGYPWSYPYDEVDLAPYLREGPNVLGIIAHCVGDYTFQSEFDGRPGLLLDGVAVLPDGSAVRLDTAPGRWTAREGACYRQHVNRSSVQTGWQECVDFAAWPDGWLLPGPCEGFGPPADLGPHPQPPWLKLEPRGMPLLNETERRPQRLVDVFTTTPADDWATVTDLSAPLVGETWAADAGAATVGNGQVLVPPRQDGLAVGVVFDLGLTCLGHPELTVESDGPVVIDLAYSERLLPSGFIATRPPANIQPRLVDRFGLPGGQRTIEVFNPRGYRYLAVVVRGAKSAVSFAFPRLREIAYPVTQRGRLDTGEPLLDRIWQIGVDTLRRNMTDAYTDCPWREQAQWWGDARLEFSINQVAFGDTRLLARGVRQGAQSMMGDGLMYGVFPGKSCILPDYNFVWVETLWDHYQHTGSDELLLRWADALRRNLAWFRNRTDETGLLLPPEGTWLFLDWAPLYRARYSTVYNLRYLQALATAAQIFGHLGEDKDADACIGRGMMTALSLTQRVFDPEIGVWYDGWDPATGEPVPQLSVHAQALAILLGLEPHTHDDLCREILIPSLLREREDVVEASPFFSALVLEALVQRGFLADVVQIIRRRWGDWVAQGHPTWPEEWDPERDWNLSLCHAWSGAPTYLLSRILLGVQPGEPGWRSVVVSPRRAGLMRVSGCVPTPAGDLRVAWEVVGGEWHVRVELPGELPALVDLGDGVPRRVTGGTHQFIAEAEG